MQDVISSVGGIYQAITIVAYFINSLYNKFIVLSDTEVLLHSFIYSEKHNYKYKIKEHKNQKIQKLKELDNDKIKNDITKTLHKEKNNSEKPNNKKKNEKEKKLNNTSYMNNKLFASKDNINISSEKLNNKVNDKKFRYIKITKKLELNNFFNYLIFLITCWKKKQ